MRNYLDKTPLEYMQIRFRRGFDQETPIAAGLTPSRCDLSNDMSKVSAVNMGLCYVVALFGVAFEETKGEAIDLGGLRF